MELHDLWLFFSICLPPVQQIFPAQLAISGWVHSYEPGPAKAFFVLKGSFSLILLLGGGQVLEFCKVFVETILIVTDAI